MQSARSFRLDLNSPAGTLRVDAFADEIPWSVHFERANAGVTRADMLRMLIGSHVRSAEQFDLAERDHPRTNKLARGHLQRLEPLMQRAKIIACADIDEIAPHLIRGTDDLAYGDEPRDRFEEARDALETVQRLAAELAAASERLIREFPVDKAVSRGAKPPLREAFIEAMARVYWIATDREAPRSAEGPFQRLCEAAWLDLGFKISMAGGLGKAIASRKAVSNSPA